MDFFSLDDSNIASKDSSRKNLQELVMFANKPTVNMSTEETAEAKLEPSPQAFSSPVSIQKDSFVFNIFTSSIHDYQEYRILYQDENSGSSSSEVEEPDVARLRPEIQYLVF